MSPAHQLLIAVVFLTGFGSLQAQAPSPSGNCVTCHLELEEETGPAHLFSRDIHAQRGLGCIDCHGGDPAADDMDLVRKARDYRGVPGYLEIPQFCARCHSDAAYMRGHNPSLPTDQLEKYRTSIHGQQLFEKKDTRVANCVSCHSVHDMGDPKLPYSTTHPQNVPKTCGKCHADANLMAAYGISSDQVEKHRRSVHGIALFEKNDLSAPACNDCHGNHGAAPPGVSSLSAVCGTCHAVQMDLFNHSPHAAGFAANNYPMCETCHSNHLIEPTSDQMIGAESPSLCVNCHTSDDGTKGLATALALRGGIDSLAAAHQRSDSLVRQAAEKGMPTTDEEFLLKEVKEALLQSRTVIHAFEAAALTVHTTAGLAKADTARINAAGLIDEYYYRRRGLGLATLFITTLAIALYIRIRRLPS